tara:strand:+ start:17995 stop:18348 length:354 start_codon:yes stop_codon:yes gene_type:complete
MPNSLKTDRQAYYLERKDITSPHAHLLAYQTNHTLAINSVSAYHHLQSQKESKPNSLGRDILYEGKLAASRASIDAWLMGEVLASKGKEPKIFTGRLFEEIAFLNEELDKAQQRLSA